MSRDAGEILKEALALPPEARAALADYLWDSLDPEVDANAEEAWRQEIKRRIVDLDSGKIAAIPWSEARARLLAKLPKLGPGRSRSILMLLPKRKPQL